MASLKRQIRAARRRRFKRRSGGLLRLLGRGSGLRRGRLRCCGTAAEKLEIVGPNFRYIARCAFLVSKGTRAELSFDIDFLAFVHVAFHDLRQFSPQHDAVPFCALGNLRAVLQRVTLVVARLIVAVQTPLSM